MEKETLEEAFKKTYFGEIISFNSDIGKSFELGAKWKQERSYSKEEVEVIAKDAYIMGRNNILIEVFNKWFEQLKKK